MTADDAVILVVDDLPQNVKLMDAVLTPRGFVVHTATSGEEALEWLATQVPDLVLLDILMPGIDGYETCRRIRANEATSFLPVVMVTASGQEQKLRAIEAGADDFVTKPFEQAELLARVRSLVRVKRYHDTIERQAAELADWNRELEAKVAAQVTELERVGRLRRFLSPQVAGLVVESGDDALPPEPPQRDHRRLLRPARLHHLRGDGRARGGHVGPARVPRGARATWSSGSRGRSSTSPATACSSSSTTRSRAPTRRSGRCGWRWRCAAAWRSSPTGWRTPRPRPGLRGRDRPGVRHPRPGRLRGPLRLRRHRHRDQRQRPALGPGRRPARSSPPSGS